MVNRHYGIRTERYKLIQFYYTIDEWELYDLKTDPLEMNNIYNDPQNKELTDSLKSDLLSLRAKYNDPLKNDSILIKESLKNRHYLSGLERLPEKYKTYKYDYE